MKLGNFIWSVRRELWENRSLYIAPLLLAALIIAGFAYHSPKFADGARLLPAMEAAKAAKAAIIPFGLTAAVLLFAGWIIGLFYSVDALHGERRDKSILFWKSMPVSDTETVLAKAFIPLVLVPVLVCLVALATQLMLLAIGLAVMSSKGIDASIVTSRLPLPGMWIGMFYGMAVHSLWFAPIAAWVLLVSAWARRAVLMWAFMPFFAAWAVERISFGSEHVGQFIKMRFMGAMAYAFKPNAMKEPITEISQLDPMRFLATPGLWIGLAFAAAFIVAAIRLRRYRDPI